jgi:hypothetical protein
LGLGAIVLPLYFPKPDLMFYIHQTSCISPQQTFSDIDIDRLNGLMDNKLKVIEPSYEGIPPNVLRRMGKAVRIGVGAALPLLRANAEPMDGIIIGTSNGGMEDCINFLNQIIDYDEGMLTPTNFVQSTPNAIASQLGFLSKNKGYNITHVHRGLSFENAIIDTAMQLKEKTGNNYLLGGVDEISTYNYNIEWLGGWYKKELSSNKDLYSPASSGSIAGEGAAMFLVNNKPANALAKLQAIHIFQTSDEILVSEQLSRFLQTILQPGEKIDLFLSGENGDSRLLKYYISCEAVLDRDITVARFKHMSGEFPTSPAIALWLACNILNQNHLPQHMLKTDSQKKEVNKILIYNSYKGLQHSFMLVDRF